MQKISTYLYTNRLAVVADASTFSTKWTVMYQNRIKIYKNVDNVITFDIKNADQKRIDITAMTLQLCVMDVNSAELCTVPIVPAPTVGLATATIPASVLETVEPQFLRYTVYNTDASGLRTVLYADVNFGAVGQMELAGSVLPSSRVIRRITRWAPITNSLEYKPLETVYYSDAVEIVKSNYLGAEESDSLEMQFEFKSLHATVTVQFTSDSVISTGIEWSTIDQFVVTETDASITKIYSYPAYNRRWRWARVHYTPIDKSSGSVDIVTLRL